MQRLSKITKILPFVIAIAAVMLFSCNSQKKYGCPNHMFTPTVTIR